MSTTFLEGVLLNAKGKAVASTVTIKNRDELRPLSYYTLCALADTMHGDPFVRADSGEVWVVDLDADGNFLRAECLGKALKVEAE